MTPTWQSAALSLVSDLRSVFGDRLQSVVVYGPQIDGNGDAPLTCLALVSNLTVADLEMCARQSTQWHRAHVATPLILPESEFRRSLDAFPLEYGEIIRAHHRVFGGDPFDGVSIAREDLRRACETQIKSHLVHLREGFIEAGGRPGRIADLVANSAAAFTAVLRHVAWLNGAQSSDRIQTTRDGARAAGLADSVISEILAIEQQRSGLPTADPARLFPEYLAAVEQLARAVDEWRG
jgi:hypothetical protein